MADYLASIFGTEQDKVNCSFYYKIGACRHGERCSRIHAKPAFSQTILLKSLYQNPQFDKNFPDFKPGSKRMSDAEAQKHFDEFFVELFEEIEDKYGELEEINVCDNISEHLIGNTYVKFRDEADAEKAATAINNRWFDGRPIYAELSPVTDFREACCRQYETGECTRGGFCNFMHLKPISRHIRKMLYNRANPWQSETSRRRSSRSRSMSTSRSRSRSLASSRSRHSDCSRSRSRSLRSRRRSNSRDSDRSRTGSRSRSRFSARSRRSVRQRSRQRTSRRDSMSPPGGERSTRSRSRSIRSRESSIRSRTRSEESHEIDDEPTSRSPTPVIPSSRWAHN